MAHSILQGPYERFLAAGESEQTYVNTQSIEERVSQAEAEKMLDAWKRYNVRAEGHVHTEETTSAHLLSDENKIKDKLFIEFGEDVEDIFAAFKHYGLNAEITEEDRKHYGNEHSH
jgi:hypothetical protein